MTTHEQHLAEIYVEMLNTHAPDMVDRFVAENYVNHNAFAADGREANRQFWTGFFAGLPNLSATMEDLVISGDRVVGRFVYAAPTQESSWASPPPATRWRCAPSTSGASRTACLSSTGTS